MEIVTVHLRSLELKKSLIICWALRSTFMRKNSVTVKYIMKNNTNN